RFVSESVLKNAINSIRSVLQDDSRQPSYIETVSRRGYRFIGHSVAAPSSVAAAARPSAYASAAPPIEGNERLLIRRAPDLDRLDKLVAAACKGKRQVVLVAGEAGIGKSTVIEHFALQAKTAGAWLATGQCIEQFGSGEPYLPVLDALDVLWRGENGTI